MVKRRLTVFICLFLICLPSSLLAEELTALLADLKQAASGTETLSSRFVQEKRLAIFSEKLLSQGRFVYQRPDRLRWELLTPVASGFVLNGAAGTRWNSLNKERGRFSIDTDPVMAVVARQLLAWARVDLDWLQQRYRIELHNSEPVILRLYPLDPREADFIESLQIQFAEDRRYVTEVLMFEPEGDSTRLVFDEVLINAELLPQTFQAPEF